MSLDFSQKPELRPLAHLAASLRSVADPLGVEILVIGAGARDLLFLHAYQVETSRRTEDVDLGVAVPDWGTYLQLRTGLVTRGDFREPRGRPLHRLHYVASDLPLDIVPFGGIERADRTIAWPPHQEPIFDCFGMKEALAASLAVTLPGGVLLSVASIPTLAILKTVAWSDRREEIPGRDAADLLFFLANYMDCGNFDRVAEHHADLLNDREFDYETAGARLLARDVADHLDGAGRARILSILQPEADAEGALLLARRSQMEIDRARRLVQVFCADLTRARREI